MTDLFEQSTEPTDVLGADESVGRNSYRRGTRIPHRPGDGSLRRPDRDQRPVPPNSLVWKYFGDYRCLLFGLRTAAIENMWPQLGQGVSDHSQVFGDKGNFAERGKRSQIAIAGVVYSSESDAKKYGIQVRNYHKSVKGAMPNGGTYHAINPETFYWAHVTFFENIYRTAELLFPRPLTRAEKEQIFEESKYWFSMYGVDDSAQPQTYDEFEAYLADVIENKLIDSSVARYTVGFAEKVLPAPPQLPWLARKLLWPRVSRFVRLTNVGAMEPTLRERLELTWTAKDERNFRLFCAAMRRFGPVYDRLPLTARFLRPAVAGWTREGIDPNEITLESARAALNEVRPAHT